MGDSKLRDSKRFDEGTSQESRIESQDRPSVQPENSRQGARDVVALEEVQDSKDSQTQTSVEDLTGLFDVPITLTEDDRRLEDVRAKIAQAKRFYFENFNYQVDLKHESFVKLAKYPNFDVGFKYKNLVEKMDKLELLVQLVNERYKLRTTCKTMYYREASLRLDKALNVDLLAKYVGVTYHENKQLVKQELEENAWFLKVYRARLQYVAQRLEAEFGLTDVEIKSVRDYDDVLVFV